MKNLKDILPEKMDSKKFFTPEDRLICYTHNKCVDECYDKLGEVVEEVIEQLKPWTEHHLDCWKRGRGCTCGLLKALDQLQAEDNPK